MSDSPAASPLPTFRDPAGSLEVRIDGVFRTVREPYSHEITEFLALSLASRLVDEGRLVASEPVASNGTLVLRHPRIAFQSYPWEWPPVLWLAAAELTIELCAELVREGWQLKDATPLNVLFEGTSPIFVDVLSIERRNPRQSIWLPYGQFVRTFLLPMLAYARLGWPLRTTLTRRDGYEPEEIYAALGKLARLRQPAFSAVTLPSLLAGSKKLGSGDLTARSEKDPELAQHILLKTLGGLLGQMRRVTPHHKASTWSDYAETATHYSDEDHAGKRAFISEALAQERPARVLDVGCNTGVYSRLAAEAGAEVVSVDTDLQAVDKLATHLKGSGLNILPLHVDLAQPTPATGWDNRETRSFLDRAAGHFDLVMMLAVIHHLLLGSQVPLEPIAELAARLTKQHLIIEWVPPTDQKFREILRGRDAIYTHLTEQAFREAFGRYFSVARETTLANGRILFHMTKV